jgi:hypothetical protein
MNLRHGSVHALFTMHIAAAPFPDLGLSAVDEVPRWLN